MQLSQICFESCLSFHSWKRIHSSPYYESSDLILHKFRARSYQDFRVFYAFHFCFLCCGHQAKLSSYQIDPILTVTDLRILCIMITTSVACALAQVLPRPQLIFPSKTWFFGIYLNFQQQKSL